MSRLFILFICMPLLLLSACGEPEITETNTSSSVSIASKAPVSSQGAVSSEEPMSSVEPVVLKDYEVRGMWISFFEIQAMCESKNGFREEFSAALDRCAQYGINTVYTHVRSHCDAYYKSDIFPWSEYITGEQGKDPGFDPLEIMLDEVHKRGMQLHAWINPYRVSALSTDWSPLSDTSPVKVWLTDTDTANDGYVVECNGGLYLNPAEVEVQRLVVDGVREIVEKYNVDGIHFDDYFYPTTEEYFDQAQYVEYCTLVSSNPLPLDDWRRANVNAMVGAVCAAVKAERAECIFGISPMASIENNYHTIYADIAAWLDGGYVDYIIPQLYFGFEYPQENSRFDVLLKEWEELFDSYTAKLYIGLGAYRIGETDETNIEWSEHDDMLKRQLVCINESERTDGYVIYSYQSFFADDEHTAAERKNLLALIKQTENSQ